LEHPLPLLPYHPTSLVKEKNTIKGELKAERETKKVETGRSKRRTGRK
jgi:hypothetical protein